MSGKEFRNTAIAPYYSGIGGHLHHILDVFDCVFEAVDSGNINLISRKRN